MKISHSIRICVAQSAFDRCYIREFSKNKSYFDKISKRNRENVPRNVFVHLLQFMDSADEIYVQF